MKTKKMKSNTLKLEVVKPRNLELHNARFQAKAGEQVSKVAYNRAKVKQETRAGL